MIISGESIKNGSVSVSGCHILYKNGRVTKYSKSPEYNSRLKKQIEKQISFACDISIDRIVAPHVYSFNFDSRLYSFEMEHIRGQSWLNYLRHASIKQINGFIELIYSYFLEIKNLQYTDNARYISPVYRSVLPNQAIISKLESLYNQSSFKSLISRLIKIVSNNKTTIPNGFCHGDLTLSNMIFTNSGLCFLDFLDSYLDSWLMDIVKLRQDLFYHWCLLANKIDSFRLRRIFAYIDNHLSQLYEKSELFNVLEAVNILRIEPYFNDNNLIRKMLSKCEI